MQSKNGILIEPGEFRTKSGILVATSPEIWVVSESDINYLEFDHSQLNTGMIYYNDESVLEFRKAKFDVLRTKYVDHVAVLHCVVSESDFLVGYYYVAEKELING